MIDIMIKKLLEDHEHYHSDFQIENFIIGSQGSNFAQYKQCLREIAGRYTTVKMADTKREILRLELKKLEKKRFFFSRLKRERHKMALEAKREQVNSFEISIKHTTRELNRFVDIAKKLKKEIGDLSNGRRQKLERELWFQKARRMIQIDQVCSGTLSPATFEFILSLPEDDFKKLTAPLARKIKQ